MPSVRDIFVKLFYTSPKSSQEGVFMARKVFIAATGMNCGKTTTSLSLMHRARKKYPRVGFVKPIGPKPIVYNGQIADKDAVLMARYFNKLDDLHLMSPLVLKVITP